MLPCPQTGQPRNYAAERAEYDRRCNAIAGAAAGARAHHIGRVCARFELESDEFSTAEDKAADLIRRGLA